MTRHGGLGRSTANEYSLRLAVIGVWALGAVMTVARLRIMNSADLQWSGTRMLLEGRDPYFVFLKGDPAEFVLSQFPNYLPLLYLMLLPLALLPLATAGAVWAGLNIGAGLASCAALGRRLGWGRWQTAGLCGALLISEPFSVALGNGQFSVVVLGCALAAAMSRRRGVQAVSTALLITKYSFVPMLLKELARRRWYLLAVVAALEVAAIGLFSAMTAADPLWVLVAPLGVSRQMARGLGDVMTLTGLLGGSRAVQFAAAGCSIALLGTVSRKLLGQGECLDAVAICALISLITFPHLQYDYCLLLPVLVAGLRRRGVRRALIVGPVAIIWFGWFLGGLVANPYQMSGVCEVLVLMTLALCVLVSEGAKDLSATMRVSEVTRREPAERV